MDIYFSQDQDEILDYFDVQQTLNEEHLQDWQNALTTHLDNANLPVGQFFTPEEVIDEIPYEDKVILCLIATLYSECRGDKLDQWEIQCQYNLNPHVAVWRHSGTGQYLVGLRGTNITGPGGAEDIADDAILAFGGGKILNAILEQIPEIKKLPFVEKVANYASGDLCDTMSITFHGRAIMKEMQRHIDMSQVITAGHSLGGRAAACLALEFQCQRCVIFNAAAPMSNPLMTGIGPEKQIHYHIAGDMISSHSSPTAMTVKRFDNSSYSIPPIELGPSFIMLPGKTKSAYPRMTLNKAIVFDLVAHHTLSNYLKSSGKKVKGEIDADIYDTQLLYFATQMDFLLKNVIDFATLGIFKLIFYFIAWLSPVPGSKRQFWSEYVDSFCLQKATWRDWTDVANCWGKAAWVNAVVFVIRDVAAQFIFYFATLVTIIVTALATLNSVRQPKW